MTTATQDGGRSKEEEDRAMFIMDSMITPLLWVWFLGIMTGHLVFGRMASNEIVDFLKVDMDQARALIIEAEEKEAFELLKYDEDNHNVEESHQVGYIREEEEEENENDDGIDENVENVSTQRLNRQHRQLDSSMSNIVNSFSVE
eukprot:CAMPEP_0114349678 /NCGR_PEP_ID=MMETSP0101-20121206/15727_1 /TAXON_ID=38822 ORGANISM="Pteridomonas danica, Strain PT" /NCGR_SAMPLE_ID=MMETSP0101 /ASSEMBLY_ACC=CAM_ASM_000211 /LENGTH=144 /DNA_ID=CAMNT_0001488401 /DNA_START=224 /DNA_END=658 /DNA_ORIENTATION=-